MRRIAAALLAAATALTPAVAARPVSFANAAPQASGALVLPLGNAEELASRGGSLDSGTRDAIGRALASAEFDYKEGSTLSLRGIGGWSQIVVIGTGSAPLTAAKLQDIGGTAATETAKTDGPVTLLANGLAANVPDAGAQIGIGAELGGYTFDRYKYRDAAKPRAAGRDAPLTIVGGAGGDGYAAQPAALTEGVLLARNLITEPSNEVWPEEFVTRTRAAFRGVGNVTIEALDETRMRELGMGSILSVGQGSKRPPRMLIVHYKGGSGAPVVLAGKGITFDSGGTSLKPGTGMWRMKGDMAGAAAVVGTALSLAKSRAPVNVVAIAALAENMPDGGATRPGDVVKAHNGKTIEIINTDAEGRLVLADAVSYGERRFKPAAIVDIATLTGAVGGALGSDYAGLFANSDPLAQQLSAAGEATGEILWRLPLHANHAKSMKSDIADIKNSAEGGSPGASLGAHFIGYFVDGGTPWAHLDIAAVSWRTDALPTVPKGAAGYGVRLLDRFVRDFRPVAGVAPAASSAAN
ncbi:leucyl aminopeptidase [Allosphingosinicella indica]|uniref:Probable cytosol aminopeptidase n=1 Tax=Allosphingosinicella indica TaxID=941907 RepID=A0A1X7GZY1_9SPHN|nr:leucyl aminopeptidase [Allosphingosinicella indica]SMF77436.1 leucyl aminopeptidase [Allosphingosinicella indica]